jgi:glutamyl-Q tRNA(Asp) synthetase
MTTNYITRFAPSPTGKLHLGHAWSALQAFDRARAAGGRLLLRIEDIDEGRSRAEFVDGIYEDLRWLGLDWDGVVVFQSQRSALYSDALERLHALGVTYRCWCTRAEIAASAGAPQGERASIYPGTCRSRTPPADPRPHCWRLDMEKAVALAGPLVWHDEAAGKIVARPHLQGDVVIARKDALASYHLAVTVDDAAQGITHVVRGNDLFEATHVHRLLQEMLGLPTPRYHHHQLVIGDDGERLAKRRASPTIAALRERGFDPAHLVKGMRAHVFPVGFGLAQD